MAWWQSGVHKDMVRKTDSVAYIIGTYPLLTTTFIDREIEALRRLEIQPLLVSIRRPAAMERVFSDERRAGSILYLLPANWTDIARATAWCLATSPVVLAGLIGYLLSRPHPNWKARFKTVLHIAEGMLAAYHLRCARITHVHAHFADRAAIVAMVSSRLLGVSYSVFAHANDIYVSPVLLTEKIQHASFVVTCTAYNRAHLSQLVSGVNCPPIELVYHGLDMRRFPLPWRRDTTQPPTILSVGRLYEKKGYDHLIRACSVLHDRGYEFTCEMIGAGPLLSELNALIQEEGLGEIVTLRGALAHKDVLAAIERASVMVQPSVLASNGDRDGIPNVLLEAMALGVPVVGTRFSGIPELIHHGKNGILVEPGDSDAMVDAIAILLDQPGLASRLAQDARVTVEQRFDVCKNIGRLVDLIECQTNVRRGGVNEWSVA